MDLNPQAIAEAQFRVVRKGYDPEQVRPLLTQAAESLRSALNRATTAEGRVSAAEARAGDADARAIEAEARAKAALQAASVAQEHASEDPEQLRRTLLTAQKAADSTVADAKQEAESIVGGAKDEAKKITTDARAAAARMVADAEQAARAAHAAEAERAKAAIIELNSRRDQMQADADLMASHLAAQRERVSGSVDALREVLARPNVLEPLPVPVTGGSGPGSSESVMSASPAAGTTPAATTMAPTTPAAVSTTATPPSTTANPPSTAANGTASPAAAWGPAGTASLSSAASGPANDDDDVAGDLASLGPEDTPPATAN